MSRYLRGFDVLRRETSLGIKSKVPPLLLDCHEIGVVLAYAPNKQRDAVASSKKKKRDLLFAAMLTRTMR